MSNVTYVTNSNEVGRLLEGINKNIPVGYLEDRKPEAAGEEEVRVYWFDLLFYFTPEERWTKEQLLRHRPEEGGIIFDLLTKHTPVYLLTHTWHYVIWNSLTQRIRFTQRDPPSLENKTIYLLATQPLTYAAKQEIETLFEPFSFAKTLYGMIRYPHAKSITCKDCHSYKALCDKLVTFIQREEEEGDFWFEKTESLLYELEDPDETQLTLDLDHWDELKKDYSRYEPQFKKFEAHSYKVRSVFDE